MQTWFNGELTEETKARVSIFDRSYLYGEGVFETLRAYGGKPAFAGRHFRRLKENCARLNLPLSFSENEFESALTELLKANQLKEAAARITVSTVGATFGIKRPEKVESNVSIFCRPIEIDPKLFQTGVKVLPLSSLVNDQAATAGIKSTSYLTKMLARAEADKAGAYESLLKNAEGFWVEGSRTNFFIVLDRVVITAPQKDGILSGITREVVLEMLKDEKTPHREDHITDWMLQNAEEIFLTGSTSEIMPVCEMLGMTKKTISNDGLALKLQRKYRNLVQFD